MPDEPAPQKILVNTACDFSEFVNFTFTLNRILNLLRKRNQDERKQEKTFA
jgi:hypothetical protein